MDIASGTNIHRTPSIKLKQMDSTKLITIELGSAIISLEFDKVLKQVHKLERKMKGERKDIANRILKL